MPDISTQLVLSAVLSAGCITQSVFATSQQKMFYVLYLIVGACYSSAHFVSGG